MTNGVSVFFWPIGEGEGLGERSGMYRGSLGNREALGTRAKGLLPLTGVRRFEREGKSESRLQQRDISQRTFLEISLGRSVGRRDRGATANNAFLLHYVVQRDLSEAFVL